MLSSDNHKECGFSDEIVSYIYDEIAGAERTRFESHLADCTACTDEFAGISTARFAMFEWHKEEFAPLPTPAIVIPYAAEPKAAEAVGFFAGLRELMTLSGWPSAVMVAGALIVCIGLSFIITNKVRDNSRVAENKQPIAVEKPVIPVIAQDAPDVVVSPTSPYTKGSTMNGTAVNASTKAVPAPDVKPVRASLNGRRIRLNKSLTASTRTMEPLIPRQRRAPALTPFDEDDDNSLRLADLFEEGGS